MGKLCLCKINSRERYCKNYQYKEQLCRMHQDNRVVRFSDKNEIYEVSRYIGDLPKLKDGRWKYENGKNKNSNSYVYDYTSYGYKRKRRKSK